MKSLPDLLGQHIGYVRVSSFDQNPGRDWEHLEQTHQERGIMPVCTTCWRVTMLSSVRQDIHLAICSNRKQELTDNLLSLIQSPRFPGGSMECVLTNRGNSSHARTS